MYIPVLAVCYRKYIDLTVSIETREVSFTKESNGEIISFTWIWFDGDNLHQIHSLRNKNDF